jgi:hypothetical protein
LCKEDAVANRVRRIFGGILATIGAAFLFFSFYVAVSALNDQPDEVTLALLSTMIFMGLSIPCLGLGLLVVPNKSRFITQVGTFTLVILCLMTGVIAWEGSKQAPPTKWVLEPDFIFYEQYACHRKWTDDERANFTKRICAHLHPSAMAIQLIRWGGKFPYESPQNVTLTTK